MVIPPPPGSDENHGEEAYIPPPPEDMAAPSPETSESEEVEPTPDRSQGLVNPREVVMDGLDPDSREHILLIARKLGLRDNDTLFKIVLLCRMGDAEYVKASKILGESEKRVVREFKALSEGIKEILNDAPEKLNNAVADIMRVSQLSKEDSLLNREEAASNRISAEAGRNLMKWGIGIAGAAAVAIIVQMAMTAHAVTTISSIRNERLTLATQSEEAAQRLESIQTLQSLAGRRLQLEGEKRGIEHEWGNLQEAWKLDGATDENQRLKQTLEELNEELSEKFDQLKKEEQNAFTR